MGKYQEPGRSAQRSERITRRQLLAGAFATVGGLTATACRRSSLTAGQQAPPDPTKVQGLPPGDAAGRRSPFVRLTREAGWTFWSYTPLGNIDGIITPSDLHYEVHHAGAAVVDPNRWTLTIHGMVERPIVLNLDDLRKFPSLSRIVFLECSGNSPVSWRSAGSPQDTVQNLVGLTSCSLWTGVAVSTLLREVGVKAGAKWALAEGSGPTRWSRTVRTASRCGSPRDSRPGFCSPVGKEIRISNGSAVLSWPTRHSCIRKRPDPIPTPCLTVRCVSSLSSSRRGRSSRLRRAGRRC